MTDDKTKKCSRCGRELPLSEFSKQKATKDGLRYWCKSCSNELNKTRPARQPRRENKEKRKMIVTSETPYPNDPLRITPTHKQTIPESGVYVYSDTCVNCESYSAFYGGCLIRESSNNQSVVKLASVPMSVSAGEKCKMWVAK